MKIAAPDTNVQSYNSQVSKARNKEDEIAFESMLSGKKKGVKKPPKGRGPKRPFPPVKPNTTADLGKTLSTDEKKFITEVVHTKNALAASTFNNTASSIQNAPKGVNLDLSA